MNRRNVFLAYLLVFVMVLTAIPTQVTAKTIPVKLSKKSVTLKITNQNGKITYGTSKIKIKKAKGIKIKKTTYKAVNSNIVTVTKKGKVTAKKKGNTKIKVTVQYINKKKKYTKKLTYVVKVKEENKADSTNNPQDSTTEAPRIYTVKFDTNGGGEISSQSVKDGDVIKKPQNPTKMGYVFVKWYLDAKLTNEYDFSSAVKKDITLYAKWEVDDVTDGDGDGIIDYLELMYGSDPNSFDDTNIDTDGDGLLDYQEIYITKTDINIIDTDGDGLSDYEEENLTGTDPLSEDTNSNQISDYYDDEDDDGLSNGYEIQINTNPCNEDTDSDGVKDGDEVDKYMTDPTLLDTDGDDAEDGWEIQNGYDPLKYNSSFKIQEDISTDDGEITASIELETSGNPLSFEFEETTEAGLLNESMPGYIGGAVSITSDNDEFDKAVISFDFDSKKLNKNANPTIYYFDEETQLLEPVSTTILGNKASAKIRKLATYILLDRNTVDEVWDTEILPPGETSHDDSVLDIAYVIDYSASMDDNDPNYQRLKIVNEFITKLRENQDRAAVIKFAAYATTLVPLTTDKEMLKNAVQGITNTSSDSCGNSEAGTNGTDGLHAALEQLKDSDGTGKYIIFLTDGEDTTSSYEYDALINWAKNNNITIYSIGMGDADKELLSHVAESTGGKYYFANAVDVDDILEGSLMSAFSEIENTTIDRELDSNGDGISDYYTRLMCEGKLCTGTGIALFSGCSYEEIQNDLDGDYDNDGLKNGEEAKVKYDSNTGKTYLYVISSPVKEDTDDDGIKDKEDTAPLNKGLAGGVIGELTIVSCHPNDSGFTGGHAWLAYKSYVNDLIDVSGLLTGYVYDIDSKSFVVEKLNQYEINKDGHLAIGNAGTEGRSGALSTIVGSCGGILYNREFYGAWDNNDFYLDVAAYTRTITEKQLDDVLMYCEENNYYNLYSHNCSSVASKAWEVAYGTSDGFKAKKSGIHGVYSMFDTPSTLKDNILMKNGADTDYRTTMLNIIKNWK